VNAVFLEDIDKVSQRNDKLGLGLLMPDELIEQI